MSAIQIILVLLVAFLAGMDGILDQFQFHQPIIACTLIGLVTGNLTAGIILGGSLQMIALGWMNIGAAVAPDAALASVASAIILVLDKTHNVHNAVSIAVPLAVAGQVLTIFVRTITVALAHGADKAAENGSIRGVETYHLIALMLQGLRIVLPAALILAVPSDTVTGLLNSIPDVISSGLAVAGGFIVAVGYAMVINMMATPALWPFFIIGFALSAVSSLNLIAMGMIGLSLALIYLQLSPKYNKSAGGSSNGGSSDEDQLDAILNDY